MANGLNAEFMQQLVLMFRVELDEHAQAITEGLIALEGMREGEPRQECLDNLFRAAHNIKGAARGVDIKPVEDIAHGLETLFSAMRHGQAEPDARMVDLCLSALDGMKAALQAFESQEAVGFDVAALLAALSNWQENLAQERQSGIVAPSAANIDAESPAKPAQPARPEVQEQVLTRIALQKLDTVSALVEELMASKIEFEDHLQEFHKMLDELRSAAREGKPIAHSLPYRDGINTGEAAANVLAETGSNGLRICKQMKSCNNRLGLVAEKLQTQIRLMRMVPAATILSPLARSVRDIAKELGKKIQYEVVGDEFELDRPVLEGIKDPLVHLLRNAIDHGIESPDERMAKGKPEAGRICVTVRAAGSRIILTVEDDGAGINPAKVLQAAVKKRLLTEEEARGLGAQDMMDLIFRPGFSSNDIITNVSGRGVGLDVVLSNLRKMKGDVRVDSLYGQGACFTLSLPLTLSVDRGLVVRAGDGLFVIPSTSIVRVMDVHAGALCLVGGAQAIRFRGRVVPVCELAAVLELPDRELGDLREKWLGVLIQKGSETVAFLVDDIIGEREIVIKRLKPPLVAVRNVVGGTLMGSGKVLLVLSPSDLVVTAQRLRAKVRIREQSRITKAPPHVLVVDDSITTRSLEKSILESQGYRVTTAINGARAWACLQSSNFDLVVTDAEMPEMNGFELTGRIKSDERFSRIPVIMVTSLASPADLKRGADVGANAYIVKSRFETDALLDAINQLL